MAIITIETDSGKPYRIADTLKHVANQLEEGYTSGYCPTWSIEGLDETEEENNKDED